MALRVPISFEFYPPKTDEQRAQLDRTAARLKAHVARIRVVHVRRRRLDPVATRPKPCSACTSTHGLDAAPHVSCMGGTREELRRAAASCYRAMGCRRIVALRGDLPSGMAPHGRLPLRLGPGRVHPRASTTASSTSKSAAIPKCIRRPTTRSPTCATSRPRSTPAPMARSPSTSTTPTRISASSTTRAGSASTIPIVPGHHADLQLHPAAALLRSLRRGDPALDRQAHAGLRRRCREHPRVRGRVRRATCADA